MSNPSLPSSASSFKVVGFPSVSSAAVSTIDFDARIAARLWAGVLIGTSSFEEMDSGETPCRARLAGFVIRNPPQYTRSGYVTLIKNARGLIFEHG